MTLQEREAAQMALDAPAIGSVWRHHNGNVYRVTAIANGNSERPEYPPTVVYKNVSNGTVWSRRVADWARSMRLVQQALAQPEQLPSGDSAPQQEPLGLVESLKVADVCCHDYANCYRPCTPRGKWIGWKESQREWQGLTDEEILALKKKSTASPINAIMDAEAMLKEKNA